MAVANRTATTANSGAAAATSLVLNKPTSTAAGDVLVTTISINGGTGSTVTTLSGWTLLTRTNSTTVLGQGVYYRVADGTEGSTFTWSCTSAFVAGVCNAYTGVDNANPIAGFTALAKTTASTAATFGATSPQAESVYGVLCVTSRNTTGTTTMTTASSGYTNDGDTCTTATTFIQANQQDQHTAYGMPLATVTPGSGTFSRSVTDIDLVLFLRPTVTTATGGFSVDVAFAAENIASAGTVTFSNFSTGYANEVLYVAIAGDAGAASNVSITSAGGLTWTKATSNVTLHGSVYVFTAVAASPVSNITIVATDAGDTSTSWGGVLYSLLGANASTPIGATKTGSVTLSAVLNDSVTTTANLSWVWAIVDDYNLSETHAVGTGQSIITNELDAGDGNTYFAFRQNAATTTSGTSVTMNTTTADFYVYDIFEIFPASTVVNGSVTQVAASVTATGGTQTVSAIVIANATVTQAAATVTATGGIQAITAVIKVTAAVSQSAGIITATGGTQAITTAQISSITQTAASVTATGGTQAVSSSRIATIAQVAAVITASGGTQVVAVLRSAAIVQLAASVTATGGTQVIVARIPPHFIFLTTIINSIFPSKLVNDSPPIANVDSSDMIEAVDSSTNATDVMGEDNGKTIGTTETNKNID